MSISVMRYYQEKAEDKKMDFSGISKILFPPPPYTRITEDIMRREELKKEARATVEQMIAEEIKKTREEEKTKLELYLRKYKQSALEQFYEMLMSTAEEERQKALQKAEEEIKTKEEEYLRQLGEEERQIRERFYNEQLAALEAQARLEFETAVKEKEGEVQASLKSAFPTIRGEVRGAEQAFPYRKTAYAVAQELSKMKEYASVEFAEKLREAKTEMEKQFLKELEASKQQNLAQLEEWKKQQRKEAEKQISEQLKQWKFEEFKIFVSQTLPQLTAREEQLKLAELETFLQSEHGRLLKEYEPQIEQVVKEVSKQEQIQDVIRKSVMTLGLASFAFAPQAAAIGATVSSLFTTGYTFTIEKRPPTIRELEFAVGTGAITSAVGSGIFSAAAKIAPSVVTSPWGRIAISTGYSAALGAVFSGGEDIQKILQSAAISAAVGFASASIFEFVARPLYYELKAYTGKSIRLKETEPTIGTGGEARVWKSEALEELGGRSLRVVGDVTEYKYERLGMTQRELVSATVGEKLPTAHATLSFETFATITPGEKIMLTGHPEHAMGWRSAWEMYHFYSAPGEYGAVTVYGGYMGIGTGYSESAKIVYGGKPGAVVTLETPVSLGSLIRPGESVSEYLWRVSFSSGETFIAPETVLGVSREWQLITPAKYERFGVELPGTYFQVEEVVPKTFQVKIEPKGVIGKIPVLRTMLSEFHEFKVAVGKFVPAETPVTIGLTQAAKQISRVAVSTERVVSIPSVHGFEVSSAFASSLKKSASSYSLKVTESEKLRFSPSSSVSSIRVSEPSLKVSLSALKSSGFSSRELTSSSFSLSISSPSVSPSISRFSSVWKSSMSSLEKEFYSSKAIMETSKFFMGVKTRKKKGARKVVFRPIKSEIELSKYVFGKRGGKRKNGWIF